MSQCNDVQPQWQPPEGLNDPYMLRYRVRRAYWCRSSRGRLGGLREQAVAFRLSDYGNADGTRCHPGVARLVADTGTSDKTVRRALAWLHENAWIKLTHRGNYRAKHSDVYALTIPAPLAVERGLWPAENGATQWAERPTWMPRHPDAAFARTRPDRAVPSVTGDVSEVPAPVLAVTGDLPPGPEVHPGLDTPFGDSITAPSPGGAGAESIDFDPDDPDYDTSVLTWIEGCLGGPLTWGTEELVLGMMSDGKHWRPIVNAALARERWAA